MDNLKDEAASAGHLMDDTSSQNDSDASFEFSDSATDFDKDEEDRQSICSCRRRVDVVNKFYEKIGGREKALKLVGTSSLIQSMLQEFQEIEAVWKSHNSSTASTISTDEKSLEYVDSTTQTSRTETLCVSTQTESITTCAETQTPVTQPEIIANSSKTADELKKDSIISHTYDVDQKDYKMMSLLVTNQAMKAKIERLEEQLNKNRFEADINEKFSSDRSFMLFKKAEEMNNCFISIQSRYTEEQHIIGECANLIKAIENSSFTDDKSTTENKIADIEKTLNNYRKKLTSVHVQVMEDRQKMITVEKHCQKILSDYRCLMQELNYIQLEKEKTTLIEKEKQQKLAEMEKSLEEREKQLEEKATLIKHQEILNDEKAKIHEAMTNGIETLVKEANEKLLGLSHLDLRIAPNVTLNTNPTQQSVAPTTTQQNQNNIQAVGQSAAEAELAPTPFEPVVEAVDPDSEFEQFGDEPECQISMNPNGYSRNLNCSRTRACVRDNLYDCLYNRFMMGQIHEYRNLRRRMYDL